MAHCRAPGEIVTAALLLLVHAPWEQRATATALANGTAALGAIDARFAALAGPNAGRRCYATFLFHVEKCAGTTLRKHFETLDGVESFKQGTLVFSPRRPLTPVLRAEPCPSKPTWFKDAKACTWQQFVAELEARAPERGSKGGRRRIFVEIAAMTAASGAQNSLQRIIDGVRRVRAAWEPRGCAVALVALVREPLSHLLATYNYFVVNKQKRQPELNGRTFADWIRSPFVHNLQSVSYTHLTLPTTPYG